MSQKPRPKLIGVKPDAVKPRKPKILIFGPSGVGKTWFSLDFPDVYYIDSEGGATQPEYVAKLRDVGGMYLGPAEGAASFDTVLDQVRALAAGGHDRKTLVIDSITKLFANEIAREAERLNDAGKRNEFGADKRPAVGYMRSLVSWLVRLDMNVILVAGEVSEWGTDSQGARGEIGKTFDCWPRLEYELDLALQIVRTGNTRTARVRKSRIAAFPQAGMFPFAYHEFAGRYGEATIQSDVTPVDLATDEQVAEVRRLLEIVKIDEKTVEKWLSSADAAAWEEMPGVRIAGAIDYLRKQVASAAGTETL